MERQRRSCYMAKLTLIVPSFFLPLRFHFSIPDTNALRLQFLMFSIRTITLFMNI